jgi:salicylate hydroxylase
MLPYMAQGANSAVEDGAVLGGILSKVSHKSDLLSALKMYQDLRKSRSWAMVRGSLQQVGESMQR